MSFAASIDMSSDSKKGFYDAVERGVERANRTLDNVSSIWIKEQEIIVGDGAITAFRTHLTVTFVVTTEHRTSPGADCSVAPRTE